MTEHSEHDQYSYQEEAYGAQDHYGAGHEDGTIEDSYDETQLPVQEQRSFFQKYGFTLILVAAGVFVIWMGYGTFAPMFAPKKSALSASTPSTADAGSLLKLNTPTAAPATDTTVANNSVIPGTNPSSALPPAAPAIAAMGVSPAAPVTNPSGQATTSPIMPVNPNDPWSQAATGAAPAPAPAAPTPATATPAPIVAAPAVVPPVIEPASPAPTVAAAGADTQKLSDLQQKFDALQAKNQQQEAMIADLQNQLAEAQAKANAPAPKADTTTTEPATPKTKASHHNPKPKSAEKSEADQATVSSHAATNWELRSASDGVAWLSRAADNQLYRVAVGDQLPGLGRITAIRQQGDVWVVVGTQGQVRE